MTTNVSKQINLVFINGIHNSKNTIQGILQNKIKHSN